MENSQGAVVMLSNVRMFSSESHRKSHKFLTVTGRYKEPSYNDSGHCGECSPAVFQIHCMSCARTLGSNFAFHDIIFTYLHLYLYVD